MLATECMRKYNNAFQETIIRYATSTRNGNPSLDSIGDRPLESTGDRPLESTGDRLLESTGDRRRESTGNRPLESTGTGDRSIRSTGIPSLEWSNIAHPLGQLIGYMDYNEKRFGALTSGARTYFIYISRKNGSQSQQLYISDAIFVGQENYLRAWAYVHHLSGFNGTDWQPLPSTWIRSTTNVPTPLAFKNFHLSDDGNNE
jgi:hypothetical protein